jgi:hypothetical protein
MCCSWTPKSTLGLKDEGCRMKAEGMKEGSLIPNHHTEKVGMQRISYIAAPC